MAAESSAMLILVYLGFFFFMCLPLSAWLAFRAQAEKRFWRIVAALLWGGFVMAWTAKQAEVRGLHVFGAILVQVGMLALVVKGASKAARWAWNTSRWSIKGPPGGPGVGGQGASQ